MVVGGEHALVTSLDPAAIKLKLHSATIAQAAATTEPSIGIASKAASFYMNTSLPNACCRQSEWPDFANNSFDLQLDSKQLHPPALITLSAPYYSAISAGIMGPRKFRGPQECLKPIHNTSYETKLFVAVTDTCLRVGSRISLDTDSGALHLSSSANFFVFVPYDRRQRLHDSDRRSHPEIERTSLEDFDAILRVETICMYRHTNTCNVRTAHHHNGMPQAFLPPSSTT